MSFIIANTFVVNIIESIHTSYSEKKNTIRSNCVMEIEKKNTRIQINEWFIIRFIQNSIK